MSFWNNKPLIITIVLILVLIILIFSTSGHSSQTGLQSLAGNAVAAIQEGLYGATEGIGSFFGKLFSATDVDKENIELKSQIAQLQSQLRDFNELEAENKRLRELLNVKGELGNYPYTTARVIGITPGGWLDEFVINVGAEDGIEKNMVVLTEDGIMGKVTSVGDTYSRAITLVNSSGGIACITERSRETGVVKVGKDDEGNQRLIIDYMNEEADVVPGDVVVTSGMGGVYPKGLTIGTVSEVSVSQSSERAIYVDSKVDFSHVEEVVVITQLFEEVKSD